MKNIRFHVCMDFFLFQLHKLVEEVQITTALISKTMATLQLMILLGHVS